MKCFTIIKKSSERVAGKNFLPLGNKPLWRHAVDALSDFSVFINTDSAELIDQVSALSRGNLHAYPRSATHIEWEREADTRGSPVNSMLHDFLEQFVTNPTEPVVLFHVTSPFIRPETILTAVSKLEEGYRSVQSVQSLQDFVWTRVEEHYVPLNFETDKVSRTQDLSPILVSRGAFFIMTKSGFLENRTRDVEPRFLFPLTPLEAVEIDTYEDYELAQKLVGEP